MGEWLRRLAKTPGMVRKRDTITAAAARHGVALGRVLNVGSKDVRIGENCVNFDIAPGSCVDVVGDAHELSSHFDEKSFDTVVLSAVLQYCHDPRGVLQEVSVVLRPGGYLLLDAPFLQPYCFDGPDLWRFTEDGLRQLCAPHFTVLEISVSIPTLAALAHAAQTAARRVGNRYIGLALDWSVSLILWPLRFVPLAHPHAAGAFIVIARKPL